MFLYFECSARVLWGCCIEPIAVCLHGELRASQTVLYWLSNHATSQNIIGFFLETPNKHNRCIGKPPLTDCPLYTWRRSTLYGYSNAVQWLCFVWDWSGKHLPSECVFLLLCRWSDVFYWLSVEKCARLWSVVYQTEPLALLSLTRCRRMII